MLFCLTVMCGCQWLHNDLPGKYYSAPTRLPYTSSEILSSGYWIGTHPHPDNIVMDEENIKVFNANVRNKLNLTHDLMSWPKKMEGEAVKLTLEKHFLRLKQDKLYLLDGSAPPASFWDRNKKNLNTSAIEERILRKYAVVIRFTDQRFLPTQLGLYAQVGDIDFDELQNNALDIATVVVVLHTSKDGEWSFVQSSLSEGWVRTRDLAFADEQEIQTFISGPFVVVLSPKADLFLNAKLTNFYGSLRMGAKLPLEEQANGFYQIRLPSRTTSGNLNIEEGFISQDQGRIGYLPYTARNIIQQAFKMLYQPYGWGGMYQAQDCSRFMHQVFSTVGIELPRDSKNQMQVGTLLAEWNSDVSGVEKLTALIDRGKGGTTLIGMRGHIMLYLGRIKDRAYAIHSVWAYRQPRLDGVDDVYIINGVAVSDLSLGEGSKKGSLLDRLIILRGIQPDP